MAIETALGKALPDTNEEVVKSANTPRDHGQGTFFFKLFRCQHSSALPCLCMSLLMPCCPAPQLCMGVRNKSPGLYLAVVPTRATWMRPLLIAAECRAPSSCP